MTKDRSEFASQLRRWGRTLRRLVQRFEPYGTVIALGALGVAFATLAVEIDLRNRTLAALEDEKELREATLVAMLLEQFDVARRERSPFSGHVQLLERIVRLDVGLEHLDASFLKFKLDEGIKLTSAVLHKVDFACSDLTDARMQNADLTGAGLEGTILNSAHLNDATLTGAKLENTDLSGTDLHGAKGLRQQQLDDACSRPQKPPVNLPLDARTGRPLVWTGRDCVPCPDPD